MARRMRVYGLVGAIVLATGFLAYKIIGNGVPAEDSRLAVKTIGNG